MSRTKRTRLTWDGPDSPRIDRDGRDDGCQHWGCNGWKRPARRKDRHEARDALRRNPEEA